MLKLINLRLAAAPVLFLVVSANAELWQAQQLNCSMNLPIEAGWSRITPPSDAIKVSVRSQDRAKIISVLVFPVDQSLPDQTFIERFKNTWFSHGTGKGKAEEHIIVSGRPACRISDLAMLNGREVHRVDTVFIQSGRLYQIDALGFGVDPMSDSAAKECVASFRFLTAAAPIPNTVAAVAADPAGKLPEHIANITLLALLGIGIVFVIVKIVRR
jgi:hypothetical protein